MLPLINIDSYDVLKIADEVNKICGYFFKPVNIPYFQFKRTYKNRPATILANDPVFFKEFLKDGFIEPELHIPLNTHQSYFCFWDETLPKEQLSYLKRTLGICHGLTILSRRKDFYDCTSFAMSYPHPSPVAYYLFVLKDLQNFSELFPIKAKHLIKETTKLTLETPPDAKEANDNPFFLPQRSDRFYLGKDSKNYVTTYEALCAQLTQQGKSYKEIGSILSMGSGTVKTHLTRLKTRTGLSLQEISLQLLHAYPAKKIIFQQTNQEDKEQKYTQ